MIPLNDDVAKQMKMKQREEVEEMANHHSAHNHKLSWISVAIEAVTTGMSFKNRNNSKYSNNNENSHSNESFKENDKSNSLFNHINMWFQLKDVELRQRYKDFNTEQESPMFAFLLTVTFAMIIILLIGILVRDIGDGNIASIATGLSILTMALLMVLGCFHIYYHFQFIAAKRQQNCIVQMNESMTRKAWVSTAYCIMVQVFNVCFVSRRAVGPLCEYEDDHVAKGFGVLLNYYFCGGYTEESIVSIDCVLLLLLGPITMASVFPSINVKWIWLLSLSSIIMFILIYAIKGKVPPIITLVLWIVGTVFMIADIQMARLNNFLMFLRLDNLIQENARLAEEYHSSEMRFLIANVAHDLKTPLMSFTTAIDLIETYTQDVFQHCSAVVDTHHHDRKSNLSSCLDNVKTCVQNLRDTNSFMLMTINRCIDCAKATKGVKLVPKLETVDLMEAMSMPLSCLRNVQNRISIVMRPLSSDICSHMITDKQWLQENLLCLLSNAVKYSSNGEVTIAVKLIDSLKGVIAMPTENINTQPAGNSELRVDKVPYPQSTKSVSLSTNNTSWLLFEVEDTGIGVPSDAMNFLFQPFKQTQRLAGGTGLGLYSLAKRIEALNGEYGVRNREDGHRGSVFWFTIPYRPDSMTATAATSLCRSNSADPGLIAFSRQSSDFKDRLPQEMEEGFEVKSSSSSIKIIPNKPSSMHILLVDDALSILKMTSLMLRKLGHQITTAENGEVAVKTVENQWVEHGRSFDVILMDLQMPVMDGLEATKRIRDMEGTLRHIGSDTKSTGTVPQSSEIDNKLPRHLIISVSANADPETESNAIINGADAFISKPFTLSTFSALLTEKFDNCTP